MMKWDIWLQSCPTWRVKLPKAKTTMDPTTRTLRRITLEDARLADEIFTVLMGEQVEPRKEWIEKNAKYAINIDI